MVKTTTALVVARTPEAAPASAQVLMTRSIVLVALAQEPVACPLVQSASFQVRAMRLYMSFTFAKESAALPKERTAFAMKLVRHSQKCPTCSDMRTTYFYVRFTLA